MKTRLLIIIGIITMITVFIISTSGAFTPLQSDISECHYTDESNIPQPCMIIDGWYDVLLKSSIQTVNNSCAPKYMIVGNNECVLDPQFIEPNTINIYDVFENSRTRLSVAPHVMVINLTGNDTVTFENDGVNTINIFVSDGATTIPLFDDSKRILSFDEYPITQVSGSVSGWSTVVTKFNCDIQSTSWGYNSGVTVSDSQGSLVAFSYDYPSDFGPSGYPCNDKPHYKSTFSMYTYGNGHNAAWCYVTIAEDYGTTTGLSCNNKSGQGGLVTTDALYGTSNSNTSEFQGVTGIIL